MWFHIFYYFILSKENSLEFKIMFPVCLIMIWQHFLSGNIFLMMFWTSDVRKFQTVLTKFGLNLWNIEILIKIFTHVPETVFSIV